MTEHQQDHSYTPLPQPIRITEQHWPDGTVPLVTIRCITYNHVNFIREAIEGFLMQETTFPVEIIIHDDASTDGTAEIVREYEAKYPRLIKPIYQTENQYSKGRKPREFIDNLSGGKYTAYCEGDDYWSGSDKLQNQVLMLESDESVSCITHTCWRFKHGEYSSGFRFPVAPPFEWRITDLIESRKFHTNTICCRTKILTEFKNYPDILSGDRFLFFLLLSRGRLLHIDEVWSVYRINKGGISQNLSYKMISKDLNMIPVLKDILPDFPVTRYKAFIYKTMYRYPQAINRWQLFYSYSNFLFYSMISLSIGLRSFVSETRFVTVKMIL